MAITTIDGLIAGFKPTRFFAKAAFGSGATANKPYSHWGSVGIPGPGSYDSTLNGVVLSSTSALVTGQLPFYDPAGGVNSYLARFSAQSFGGTILLCDRLWHNGGYTITSTSAQNSTTPTWPARDDDGATAGKGVLLGLEISGIVGAATPTITVTYTNSVGTGSRTAGFVTTSISAAPTNSFFPITLQAGDLGVQSLQSIQLSASWLSGTMNMVAYRVLAVLGSSLGTAYAGIDAITSGMPQLFNGTVPFLIINPPSTGSQSSPTSGVFTVAQG